MVGFAGIRRNANFWIEENIMYTSLETACISAVEDGLLHGIVVAAGRSTSIDFLWAWGNASVYPERRPIAVNSIFDMASVTKVIATATACGICIDRGLLNPDAPVADYIGNIGTLNNTRILVRDLATHVSGFSNQKVSNTDYYSFLKAIVETPPQWLPRQRFEYSCRNFILLGHIVELVTGTALATFCKKNIFGPLGMKSTLFGPVANNLKLVVPTEQPAGIISDGQARIAGRPVGNAGLFSTAEDLARFCQMMLCGSKKELLHGKSRLWLMHACSYPTFPLHAFGWRMLKCSEALDRPQIMSHAAIGHSGWTGQSVWIDPEQDRYVIVLTNRTHQLDHSSNYDRSRSFRGAVGDILLSHLKA
jgi:CubicO group peptidase (beta-lactamase class C family)